MPLTSDTRDWPCWFWFFFSIRCCRCCFNHLTLMMTTKQFMFFGWTHCLQIQYIKLLPECHVFSLSLSLSFAVSLSLCLFLCLSLVLCVLTIVGRQSYHKSIFFRQKIPLLALNSNKRSAIDFFLIPWHFFAAPKQSIISLNLTASEKNA